MLNPDMGSNMFDKKKLHTVGKLQRLSREAYRWSQAGKRSLLIPGRQAIKVGLEDVLVDVII